MLQLILGYTFAALLSILSLLGFVSMFLHAARRNDAKTGNSFLFFLFCGALAVLVAWIGGL